MFPVARSIGNLVTAGRHLSLFRGFGDAQVPNHLIVFDSVYHYFHWQSRPVSIEEDWLIDRRRPSGEDEFPYKADSVSTGVPDGNYMLGYHCFGFH